MKIASLGTKYLRKNFVNMNERDMSMQSIVVPENSKPILERSVSSAMQTLQGYLRQCIDSGLLEEAEIFSAHNKKLQALQQFIDQLEVSSNHQHVPLDLEEHADAIPQGTMTDNGIYEPVVNRLTGSERVELEGSFPPLDKEIPRVY